MNRWASAELTLHEEGSMFGSSITSSKSASRGEASAHRDECLFLRKSLQRDILLEYA